MPAKAPHFCAAPGCGVLVTGRRCRAHMLDVEHARPNVDVRRWYRTPRWKALRARLLREAGYECATCGRLGLVLEVDHKAKHGGDRARFWDRGNLQVLCRSCHATKTQRGE